MNSEKIYTIWEMPHAGDPDSYPVCIGFLSSEESAKIYVDRRNLQLKNAYEELWDFAQPLLENENNIHENNELFDNNLEEINKKYDLHIYVDLDMDNKDYSFENYSFIYKSLKTLEE